MIPRIKFLRRLFLFSFPLLLSAKIAVAAVPVETSHYNCNTYANLNTITSTGTITFTIAYDAPGEIKWYKDNVLVQTNASTTTASITTSWTAVDYGNVKQMRVNSINSDGTSTDTIWNAEVQQTGTATISRNTAYPQPLIDGRKTLYVTNGWTNLPSLYLAAKQTDNAWITYESERTYYLKTMIGISGSTLCITTDTAKEIKMQGLPATNSYDLVKIKVLNNGTVIVDKVNLYGWDAPNDCELAATNSSPLIISDGNNRFDITNSNFRHVMVHYSADKSTGDIVSNNSFFEGNPANIRVLSATDGSRGQIISDNAFIHGYSFNYNGHRDFTTSGIVLRNNQFHAQPGSTSGNLALGRGTEIIGNEATYSGWNMIEYPVNTFSKYNNLHDNGGHHNGFNGMGNYSYSTNDYCHDFSAFAGFYIQVSQPNTNDPSTWTWPHHVYIFNAYGKGTGIDVHGLYDGYFYNFTGYDTGSNVQMGADHIVYRKCNFLKNVLKSDSCGIRLVDYYPEDYGFTKNVFAIDSLFTDQNRTDIIVISPPQYGGNPILHSINSYRKNSDNSIRIPYAVFFQQNGEVRNYAWLDTLVQDAGGNPVSGATVTVEPLTDANYPAIDVLLPPPPPDLNAYPAEQLPIPSTGSFVSSTTGADGHTPLPNYGWSANVEPTPALLFYRQKAGNVNFSTYTYRITATYNSQSVSKDVTPDASWYREDPCQPAKTVVLTFDKPAGKYALNVNGGTGSGLYDQSQSVNIVAGAAPAGKVFDKWIGDTTTVNDVNSASTYIIVPSSDVSITAYYKDITYHLTVTGGTGSGDYPAGKIVVADAAPANGAQVFYKWTGDTEHVVSPTVYSSTLIMPAHDVTVAATYRDPASYTCRLTVADGQGTDFYAVGDNVSITADAAPSGKVFDHWEGDTSLLADAGSSNTTLTGMPDDYLIVYPVYRASGLASGDANLSNLTVSGGALLPRFSSYTSGYAGIVGNGVTSVTVTPTASQGTRAAITVNGTAVNSGSASGTINLNTTGSTIITVVVTAPDTTTARTYTISVTRTALATGYTLAAPSPSSGEVNATSGNFTVTPNGKYTGTITITPTGGGLSTPLNLTFSNSNESRTFTITPTAAGPVTLTPTNNSGLADPAAVTYTSYVPGTLRNVSWNYPNPVDFTKTDKTTITYTIAEECNVYICLYTLAGDLAKVLVDNKTTAPGKYYMDWYGDTDGGGKAASGVYLYVAKIGNDVIRKKIVILR